MKNKTQEERLTDELESQGEVTNYWGYHNYMPRLGSRIYDLKKAGWNFETFWREANGRREYVYKLVSKPK